MPLCFDIADDQLRRAIINFRYRIRINRFQVEHCSVNLVCFCLSVPRGFFRFLYLELNGFNLLFGGIAFLERLQFLLKRHYIRLEFSRFFKIGLHLFSGNFATISEVNSP